MKKIYYESPTVEVVDVRVEGGFSTSDVGTYDNSSFGYDVSNIEDMEDFSGSY